jgi:hypothetical protein
VDNLSARWMWVLYPLHIWFHYARRNNRVWVHGILLLGPGAVVGLQLSAGESAGWTRHEGVVVKAGVTPTDDDDSVTQSVVHFTQNGVVRSETFVLAWWHRDNATIPIWTKDSLSSPVNPAGWGGLHWILFEPVLPAVVVWWLLWASVVDGRDKLWRRWPEWAFKDRFRRRQRERQRHKERGKAQPATAADLVNLCITHADVRVTIKFAIGATRCSGGGVYQFRDQYFPGRDWVTLFELVQHLTRPNPDFINVCRVVIVRLQRLGVVGEGVNAYMIPRPPAVSLDTSLT